MEESQSTPSRARGPILRTCFVVLLLLAGASSIRELWAQSVPTTSSSAPSLSALLATFQSEQQSLETSFQQLVAQDATPAQLQAWQQQNASRIAAQQQRAQAISASQPVQPMPYVTDVNIPAGASPTMQDFLTERANLQNARAQIYNQQLQSTGTVDEAKVEATFQNQNSATLEVQAQRARTLAQESASQPLPTPPALVIPPGASANLQQFLALHDQLTREEIQVHNQRLALSYADRQAAIEQWRQQNAASFQQLQLLAQQLANDQKTSGGQ
jgi:hypothetical protein